MKQQFKPKREEKQIISLRISTSLLEELDRKSIACDISRNALIIQAIEFALKNMVGNK